MHEITKMKKNNKRKGTRGKKETGNIKIHG